MYTVPPISGGKRKPPKTPSPPNVIRGEDPLVQSDDALFDVTSNDSLKAWDELDLDIANSDIGSPSNCSTTSEQLYLRTPGFEHHGHVFKNKFDLNGTGLTSKDIVREKKPSSRPGSGKKSDSKVQLDCSKTKDVDGIVDTKDNKDNTCSLQSKGDEKLNSTSKVSCKKKKGNCSADKLINVNDIGCLKEPNVPKIKGKKEPLPMKLRALPLSFWQQPNQASEFSPAQCAVPLLPPLFKSESHNEVTEIRPVTPENKNDSVLNRGPESSASSVRSHQMESYDAASNSKYNNISNRIIKLSNADLLMKLFDGLEETHKPSIVRRGRPKKETPTLHRKVVRGEDPCLGSAATEGLLPLLSGGPENRASALIGASGTNGVFKQNNLTSISVNRDGSQTVTILSVKDGDNNVVSLPALSLENNYSQMLSELVVKL